MHLSDARGGDTVRVLSTPGGDVGAQMICLGLCEGSKIACVLRIPAGPVVIRHGNLELALGRGLASRIRVERCDA